MMARRNSLVLGLAVIAVGVWLIFFVEYAYLGPDIAFALRPQPQETAVAGSNPIVVTTPVAQNLPLTFRSGKAANRVVVPRMNLDAPVQDAHWTTSSQNGTLYSDWVIPYQAVGHLVNTANPGEAGNVVLSGHHNLTGPNQFGVGLFAGLWNLKPGDLVFVYNTAGQVFAYKVVQSYPLHELGEPLSVREQHAQQVLAQTSQPVLTMVTCWNGQVAPLSGNSYRWIISATLAGTVNPNQVPTTK